MEADRTLYIRNIPQDVSEALLYELFLQAGPIETVTIKGNIAFVTFEDEESVLYACSLFEGLQLYGVEIVIRPRAGSKFTNVKIRSVQPYSLDKHRTFSVQSPSPMGNQKTLGPFVERMLPGSRYQINESVGSSFLNSPHLMPSYHAHSNMMSSASYPLLFPNWSPVFAPHSPLPKDWRSSSGSLLGPPSRSMVEAVSVVRSKAVTTHAQAATVPITNMVHSTTVDKMQAIHPASDPL
ncbi:hypothetical protein P879_10242 [Paragonimus westermani]|uniref:RRM domain-containing protein n=1 Tax=Paragonimus westermani TaxID=34504 RepID=A0A8T0D9U7_9TREM|nr:hypothetical protein P879_10242 [Paragonimus westermani]